MAAMLEWVLPLARGRLLAAVLSIRHRGEGGAAVLADPWKVRLCLLAAHARALLTSQFRKSNENEVPCRRRQPNLSLSADADPKTANRGTGFRGVVM